MAMQPYLPRANHLELQGSGPPRAHSQICWVQIIWLKRFGSLRPTLLPSIFLHLCSLVAILALAAVVRSGRPTTNMDTLQLVIGLIIVGIVGIVTVLGIILEATWRLSRTASRS